MANNVSHPQADTRYMAPEQLEGNISKESDQYALGCLAYEVLTGHPPSSYQDGESPAPLTQFVPGLPHYLEVAVLKALARNPAERHASITAFIEAFTSYSLKVSAIRPTGRDPEAVQKTSSQPAPANNVTMVMSESDIAALASQSPPVPISGATADPQRSAVAMLAASQASSPEAMRANFANGVTMMEPIGTMGTMEASNGYEQQLWQYAPANEYEQPWQSVPVNRYEQSWQYAPASAHTQLEVGSMPPSLKKRISRRGWIIIALVCLVVLTAGTIPMLLPLMSSKPQVDQQQAVTPTLTRDNVTATVAKTPTVSATATPVSTPTTQPTSIPVVQATTPTPVAAANVAPTPTAQPTNTPTPKPTATPTPKPTATSQPTPTPTPACTCGLLFCSCSH